MSARLTARDRTARLLAIIPWVVERGGAPLDEIATRFGYPRDQLLSDLQDVVFYVGVHPFTPDSLVELEIADDAVRIRYADWFARPLRLPRDGAARLLTAGRAVLAHGVGDDDHAGPLLRALAKLELALGDGAADVVEVRLGDAAEHTLETLREAATAGTVVEVTYYAYNRDELTTRRIEPRRVFSEGGNWYVAGWCHLAGADRVFRVDRIRSAAATGEAARHPAEHDEVVFSATEADPRVVLALDPGARWVAEQYPCEAIEEGDDGRLRVRLAVTAVPWLERLLLRLGPRAEIEHADPPLDAGVRAGAARRVLARYGR